MKLLIATRNPHKLTELAAIFKIPGLEFLNLSAFTNMPEVEEDGLTFRDNAIKKARAAALASGMWTMADDSGIEVLALGGQPGVRSARYAGEPVNYAANNAKLLKAMNGVADRRARFSCAVAICDPKGVAEVAVGYCHGTIGFEERGSNGFGYDPLFIPSGFAITFAEMSAEEKNKTSHRARALHLAATMWKNIFEKATDTPTPLAS